MTERNDSTASEAADGTEKTERREFFATAGKLAAVMAALGLSGEAWAAEPGTRKLLESAISMGSVDKALAKEPAAAKTLSKSQMDALKSLSSAELKTLSSIQRKLAPLGVGGAADGNGNF